MAKNRSRRDQNLRSHLAYLAARLIAEDGVGDYASAKQKAARQAGLADANLLPDNSEPIEVWTTLDLAMQRASESPT